MRSPPMTLISFNDRSSSLRDFSSVLTLILQRIRNPLQSMSLPTWTEAATRQPRQSVDMSNSKVYDRVGSKERHQSQHNHRDLENTNPQRSPSHRREDDFADNSRTSYSRVNILDSSGYDKFDARSGRDIEEIFDAFKYREVCLNSSAKTKLVANFLNKIKDHINKEACLEAEVSVRCV